MTTWQQFRQEAFGDPYLVWHDGPDFSALRDRWREDPSAVEALLKEGLAESDPLAAESVGELPAPVPVALREALTAAAPAARGDFAICVASALHRLTGDEAWSKPVVDVLLGGDFWSVRLNAAIALGRFAPTVDLIAAAMRGVQADDYLVRYHSANTLLRWAGLPADISAHEDFPLILDDADADAHARAAAGLAGSAAARLSLPH